MQQQSERISNEQRSEATKAALIAAARKLFVEKGYAETGTPEIVAAAGVTRGALYHHFADKADLFFAVAIEAAREVAEAVAKNARSESAALTGLLRGGEAYFTAMSSNGRAKLLLIDAPAILPPERVRYLSEAAGEAALSAGLAEVIPKRKAAPPLRELTVILSAAFDRAALAIAEGEKPGPYRSVMKALLEGIAA